MAFVDIKITTWERIFIAEEDVEHVKHLLESGEIFEPNQLWNYIEPEEVIPLAEVDEWMTPEENGGESTMELHLNNAELIWSNKLNNYEFT
jgi:hypothetical protein